MPRKNLSLKFFHSLLMFDAVAAAIVIFVAVIVVVC